MDEKKETRGLNKAFECMKHITTLCTGIIGLTVTFSKEFKTSDTDLSVPYTLELAWLSFVIALVFALWSLLAITGSLNAVDQGRGSNDAMTSNIQIPSFLAILAFLIAIGLTAWAGASISR